MDERLDLIGRPWDSIDDGAEEADRPMPEWHQREPGRRLAALDADPDDVVSWEEVRARLLPGQ
ncbi:MAG TPA: addiction module protein [Armatimonadota bacterium]